MNHCLLLSLLMAHVVGDFYLQTDKSCKEKEEAGFRSPFLYAHSAIIGLISWAFVPAADFWPFALLLLATHVWVDAMKSYLPNGLWTFLADQAAHIAVIGYVASQYQPTRTLPIQLCNAAGDMSAPMFAFGLLCVMKPANILIRLVLERYKIGEAESCKSIKNAGALIGNLERILTLVFVMLGQYEAVGFIIAAKSLLRFKDTDTAKTEYVLAGTLLSFGIATLCGLAVKHVIAPT